ncbi:MAG: aconitate hydratase AcnA [Myxococcales bacterium]|nr:aconitate hydratase AcnA [Myxococcales bacterium]
MTSNTFDAKATLAVGDKTYTYFNLPALEKSGFAMARLPVSTRILLENLLRHEDGTSVKRADIETVAGWQPTAHPEVEIAFRVARVILQDFTGVPAVVDLAAMRDAMTRWGGDPNKINPLQPVDLVIDHSVQVDHFGTAQALQQNADLEFDRNKERYQLLRWAQTAFSGFSAVPPDTGIVHQVNLEFLARAVFSKEVDGETLAYPDTCVGTDSHTPMVNGLGVVGWGVGGIEAEAAMLGQPITMLLPEVVGFRFSGKLKEGVTATDLVLTVVQMLRKHGVVGKFVEFFGSGLGNLAVTDRATISNMAPEYGATIGYFPIDDKTVEFLRFTGRSAETVALVEAYCKAQGLFRTDATPDPRFSSVLELDLASVEPSMAGPKRPQDRVALTQVKSAFAKELPALLKPGAELTATATTADGHTLRHGSVVIAAITSCTNTSNPSVLMAAGLLAKNAVARGLRAKPWIKTSLAPGSKVVTEYLKAAGLLSHLETLGFHVVGYGCTTCIGNSGPLPEATDAAVTEGKLVAASVLSGNRNFEGRVHAAVRANYLASPPLVVAYALVGDVTTDITTEPIGADLAGKPVYLHEIWPSQAEVEAAIAQHLSSAMFRKVYADVFSGDANWQNLDVPTGSTFEWQQDSTYIQNPPFFQDLPRVPEAVKPIIGARCLAVLGDSVTTDHISPAGNIAKDSPAGQYLIGLGVSPKDFNGYGARRGNHQVMMRGTFANVRLKNALVPDREGWWTKHLPSGETQTIFDASMRYQSDGTPLCILAGAEYGSGSSRDWAAKGPMLLGIKFVIAQSYERIHRSNLVGMGILPLQFLAGESAQSLGLTGSETFDVVAEDVRQGDRVNVRATASDGTVIAFATLARIDTPVEVEYYRNGGILPYVLRGLAA